MMDGLGSKEQAIANTRRLLRAGEIESAAAQAREILAGDDRCGEAFRLLSVALRSIGDVEAARQAELAAIRESGFQHEIFQATLALADNRLDFAEQQLREYLQKQPDDPVGLRLLGELAARIGRLDPAEMLARDSLKISPGYGAAKTLLDRIGQARKTSNQPALSEFPRSSWSASVGAQDQYAEALELYERVVERFPESSDNWVSYGHILRTVGRQQDAVAAYRRAIGIKADAGEAWWALADLKTRELNEADIDRLEATIASEGCDAAALPQLHFALGRALEQAGQFKGAFENYAKGSRLRRPEKPHDRTAVSRHVDQSIGLFDSGFLADRANSGFPAPDPIFVLGMPRAGSTLIEQILASHSQVEGTMELGDIPAIAGRLADGKEAGFEKSNYLPALAALEPGELERLGKGYMWGTALRRQTSKPYFIDKMPNNWLHLGMILTILPKAKIIDARRHPLACGMSLYRQHFARGQEFSYDLTDIGSFYADYVRMMQHFDRVAPGRVIRVIHEELVSEPEPQIRLLLDRLELPFDETCLRSHENPRAVRTSSSEQVRQPISAKGVDQWKAFEPWLAPLKSALGEIAEIYPEVPAQRQPSVPI